MKSAGFIRLIAVIAAALLLEAVCRLRLIDPFTMIAPSAMVGGLWDLLHKSDFTADVARSLGAVAAAGVSAIVVGFWAGIVIHSLPRVRRTVNPLFASYYSVPIIVFYPLFIVLFGLNDWPKVAIAFLYAVIAMVVSTINGLDRVPAVLRKTAITFQMGPVATALRIVLPCAAPYIFTGVKLAMAYAFIGIVGSEFILSSSGIGYEISFAYNNFDNDTLYALILFIILVSVTLNLSLFAWEKMLLRRRGLR